MTRAPTEHSEQRALVLRLRACGIPCFSVPNGAMLGGRNKYAVLGKLKAEGLLPGAPDLVLIPPAPCDGRPVFVEMKRKAGGRASENQKRVRGILEAHRAHVVLAEGCDDAVDQIAALGYRLYARGGKRDV